MWKRLVVAAVVVGWVGAAAPWAWGARVLEHYDTDSLVYLSAAVFRGEVVGAGKEWVTSDREKCVVWEVEVSVATEIGERRENFGGAYGLSVTVPAGVKGGRYRVFLRTYLDGKAAGEGVGFEGEVG